MTDRELLEKAARAAGMYVLPQPWPEVDGWFFCTQHDKPAMHFRKVGNPHHHSAPWMPLTDDGDALRLAAKLRLHIDHHGSCVTVWAFTRDGLLSFMEEGTDTAATRWAIVRAAASMAIEAPAAVEAA